MKKILILVTLLFMLVACQNDTVVTQDPAVLALQAEMDAMREEVRATDAFQEAEKATLVAWVEDLAYQPTWTPYPTPVPSMTPTTTLAYDICKVTGGMWIRTLVKAKLYSPRLNKAGTGLKILNGKLIIVVVGPKDHTGINPGVTLCAFERRQTDKGAAFGFWYQRALGYQGDIYGYYLLASQVERIVVE